jgi:hypothetical protein
MVESAEGKAGNLQARGNPWLTALKMLASPVMGFIYVVVMPFIAIGAAVGALGWMLLSRVVSLLLKSVSFAWQPTMSYFLGGSKGRKTRRKGG